MAESGRTLSGKTFSARKRMKGLFSFIVHPKNVAFENEPIPTIQPYQPEFGIASGGKATIGPWGVNSKGCLAFPVVVEGLRNDDVGQWR